MFVWLSSSKMVSFNGCQFRLMKKRHVITVSRILNLIGDNSGLFGGPFFSCRVGMVGRKGPAESGIRLADQSRHSTGFPSKQKNGSKTCRENSSSTWKTRRTSHRNFSKSRKCRKRMAREVYNLEKLIIWIAWVAAGSSSSTQPFAIQTKSKISSSLPFVLPTPPNVRERCLLSLLLWSALDASSDYLYPRIRPYYGPYENCPNNHTTNHEFHSILYDYWQNSKFSWLIFEFFPKNILFYQVK